MHMGRPRRKADGRRSRQLARQSLHLAEIGHLNQQTLYKGVDGGGPQCADDLQGDCK